MTFLVMHQWSLVVFLGILVGISLSNLIAFRRLPRPPSEAHPRRISALVPARDEGRNIAGCLRGLLSQDGALLEVIVLDDGSTDETTEEVRRFEADPRLRMLRGAPLPEGWLGKPWACHQLSRAARGEMLLFVDADVVFHRGAVASIAAAFDRWNYAAFSVLPREVARRVGEAVVLPILPWSLQTFIPFALLRALTFRQGSLSAVGQVLAFRASVYRRIGGHEAVRSEIAEDREIARRVGQSCLTFDLLDGSRYAESRPYHGWRESADGFSKSLYATFGRRPLPYLFVWTWLAWVAWEPLLVLPCAAGGTLEGALLFPAGAAVLLELLLWGIAAARFRTRLWHALFYPATAALLLGIAVRSALWHRLGRGQWKGRRLRPS